MASFGLGFASGMNSGMSMGKMLMDTYSDARQKRDIEDASSEDQTVIDKGLTDEQKAQIQANREMKREDGSNLFEVEDTANGARMRLAGNPDAEWATVAGKRQYQLGNKTQDTEFTQDQVQRHRQDRIADVYTKNGDPMKGLQYRQAAREDRYAGNEEKVFELIRNSANLSDDEVFSQAAKLATGHGGDGLAFGYTKGPDGQNLVGMVGQDGKLHLQPATRDMVFSKLLQYVSPKNFQQERAYGLDREKLSLEGRKIDITDRHYRAAEDIERSKIGRMGGLNPAQQYALDQAKRFDAAKAEILDDPKLSDTEKAKKIGILGMKFGQGGMGAGMGKSSDDVQIEFDPETNTQKIKGTGAAVHNYRMAHDSVYRAGYGGNDGYTVQDPKAKEKAAASAPMLIDYNPQAFDHWLSEAKSGNKQAKRILAGWLESGDLSRTERTKAAPYSR